MGNAPPMTVRNRRDSEATVAESEWDESREGMLGTTATTLTTPFMAGTAPNPTIGRQKDDDDDNVLYKPPDVKTPSSTNAKNRYLCVLRYKHAGQKGPIPTINPVVIDRYFSLPFPNDIVVAEYVWVDAAGNTRSKSKTLPASKAKSVDTLPKCNFDVFSTGQVTVDDSDVILRPCRIFRDPFRPRHDGVDNILVLCDCWTPQGEPLYTNSRAKAMEAFAGKESDEIWFSLKQEFTLFHLDDKRTPLGWNTMGCFDAHYCQNVGLDNSYVRHVTEAMYRACLYAGISISGTNGKVMLGRQEYQVGPSVGIDSGDQLYMSRYILQRVCEDFQVYCTLHPKPRTLHHKPIVDGDWNRSGMHTKVSTKKMRDNGGLEEIKKAIYKLGARHKEHMAVYGENETANIPTFSYGVAKNRGVSIRIIGHDSVGEGNAYLEDHRPISSADPYLVTGKIMATIMEDFDAPVIQALDMAAA